MVVITMDNLARTGFPASCTGPQLIYSNFGQKTVTPNLTVSFPFCCYFHIREH